MPAKAALVNKSNIDYMAVMKKKYMSPKFDSNVHDVNVVDPTTQTLISRHQGDNKCLMLKPVPLDWLRIKGKKTMMKSSLVKKLLKIFKVVKENSSLMMDKSK